VKKNKTGNKPKVEVIAEPVKGDVSNESKELKGPESLESVDLLEQSTTKPQGMGMSVSWVRRLLPDVLKVAGALIVISVALVILLNPPLVQSDFPKVTYSYNGTTYTNAILYRPLAMPTRYYIALPEKIADRYQVFAVDRRREVATLMTNTLSRSIFGMPAIKRTDPMGMDLEFRHLDNSEWRVSFLPETILFSNAVLAVRLDVK
jgi:hypothetical protein